LKHLEFILKALKNSKMKKIRLVEKKWLMNHGLVFIGQTRQGTTLTEKGEILLDELESIRNTTKTLYYFENIEFALLKLEM